MELCWCAWLLSFTCYWALTSSWSNKADCRPSLLLSIADQWESLLTGASFCSMIIYCVVLDGAFMCVYTWEGMSGGCKSMLLRIYLLLYSRCKGWSFTSSLFYLFECRPQRRIDSWATRQLFVFLLSSCSYQERHRLQATDTPLEQKAQKDKRAMSQNVLLWNNSSFFLMCLFLPQLPQKSVTTVLKAG